jgi:phosphoglycerol transferase MdoB-like AlkP superfamily enzyme
MKRTFNFLLLTKKLYKSLLLGLILFLIVKLIFIFRFGNFNTFTSYASDLPIMIFNGLRFDLQSIAYIFLLIFVINLFALAFKSDKFIAFINTLSINLIPILLILSLLLLIADQQFYSFFKLHFNAVAFDFFNEEPKLLLKSIWLEHPIIKICILVIIAYFILRYFTKRIYSNTNLNVKKINIILQIPIIIIALGLYFLLIRGSIGTFPLQKEDITVSENDFINACTTNGLFSLKEAYAEKKKEFKILEPNQVLKKYGYSSIEQAIADYKGVNIDSLKNKSLDELIFTSSSINQSEKKYNVVYLLMESMSNHFLNFHSDDCNLLGALEPHFKSDVVFRNFQSSSNGTIYSLENNIINSPFHPIFDTKYRFQPFDLSMAKPFKDAGYKTSFITGIELGWRHLDQALKHQYFDNSIGKSGILRNLPGSKANDTWGVFDQYVFDYIYEQLIASDTAMFIMSLSSTNHTPYELPKDYTPYKIDPKIAETPEFSVGKDRVIPVLTAFQYSNDAVGRFMNKIKNSKLAENTIVIVTGDHNIRSVLSYNKQELMPLKFSVPLYLYIPEELKNTLYIDTNRWASHYDIMTSIYPYILNGINYANLGQNIFDKNTPNDEYYSLNDAKVLYSENADVNAINKKLKARKAIVSYYYSTILTSK